MAEKKAGTGKSIYFTPRGLEILYEMTGQALAEESFDNEDVTIIESMQKKANNMLSALSVD